MWHPVAEPYDHDQLFKELIREFFAEFMTLFFDKWAKRFDLTAPAEWPRTELYAQPPGGPNHVLDLVAVEASRRIGEAPLPDRRKMLLAECVEGYADLSQEEVDRMAGILLENATGRAPAVNKISYMKGREEGKAEGKLEGKAEGVEQGRRKGVIEFLEAMLVNKFGVLPLKSLDKLRHLPEADLTRIGLTFDSAASLTELGL